MKKILKALLIAILFMIIIPLGSCDSTEENTTPIVEVPEIIDGIKYSKVSSSYVKVVSADKTLEEAVILSTYDGLPVTTIGLHAFEECKGLKSIVMPDSITTIEDFAFDNCSSLKNITFSNCLTRIGYGAFEECKSLTSIKLPDSLISLGNGAFEQCEKLESVILSNNLEKIERYTFYECKALKSVNIPNSVTSIEHYAFGYCEQLKEIIIPDSVTSVEDHAFSPIVLENVSCPACAIKSVAYSSLKKLVITSGDTLPNRGFYWCNQLESITLPETLKTIEEEAFTGCDSLKVITLPDSVTSIGRLAFSNRKIEEIIIPNGVTILEPQAFSFCRQLKKVILPDGIKEIGESAFSDCTSLEGIEIPKSVTKICDHAFEDCGLKTLTIPDTVEEIHWTAFYGCNQLESITLPAFAFPVVRYTGAKIVTITGGDTIPTNKGNFNETVETIILPDTIITIEPYAFYEYVALKNLVIPKSVKNIGTRAFCHNFELGSLTYEGTMEEWDAIEKGDWFDWSNITRVYCKDGTIKIDNR